MLVPLIADTINTIQARASFNYRPKATAAIIPVSSENIEPMKFIRPFKPAEEECCSKNIRFKIKLILFPWTNCVLPEVVVI